MAGGPLRSSGLQVLLRMLSFGEAGMSLTEGTPVFEAFGVVYITRAVLEIVETCGNIFRYITLCLVSSIMIIYNVTFIIFKC